MATQELKPMLDKVNSLLALAQGNANKEESRNAAIQAAQMIKENDLVLVPRQAMATFAAKVSGMQRNMKEEKNRSMMLGAVMGFFGSKAFAK